MTVTIARLATEFLERPGLSQSTIGIRQRARNGMVELGRLPVESINRQLISEYLQRLEHLSITTHHRHQAIIQALFNYGVAMGYLQTNPIAGLNRRNR